MGRLALLLLVLTAGLGLFAQPASDPPKQKLLIAFASFKERPKQPTIYFYEHDGVGEGKVVGRIPTVNLRSDSHPSLSRDGRYCAFASEIENQTSKIFLWDREEKKLIDLPKVVNDTPNAKLHPSLS